MVKMTSNFSHHNAVARLPRMVSGAVVTVYTVQPSAAGGHPADGHAGRLRQRVDRQGLRHGVCAQHHAQLRTGSPTVTEHRTRLHK